MIFTIFTIVYRVIFSTRVIFIILHLRSVRPVLNSFRHTSALKRQFETLEFDQCEIRSLTLRAKGVNISPYTEDKLTHFNFI